MTTAQNEILGLERKYWQAMKDADAETAVAMTRFPCVLTSARGEMRVDEAQYRKMMESHDAAQFKDIEIQDPKVDSLGPDTALISYSIQFDGMDMLDVWTWLHSCAHWGQTQSAPSA
jgi:hypothetical protein